MVESVAAWWARRQFSRDADVPYAIGTYRAAWSPYPALIRQYHPELNEGIALTQVPPAAEVLLLWQCEVGHLFAATPGEQRQRPGRQRRRSAWCPECSELAQPRTPRPAEQIRQRRQNARPARVICGKTPRLVVGEPFASECAPPPASAVEADLRQRLSAAIEFTGGYNAIRVGRPFFDHLEVWPDILVPELRIAVEYDSPGRHGLEHVGRRETVDRQKDRAVRSARWEVVRLRAGRLEKLGPYDLQIAGVGRNTVAELVDVFRSIRGDLIVDAYRR